MNLVIKTRGNQPISDRDKRWAQAKFLKLKHLVPANTLVEVTLEDLYGPKGGLDKKVHVQTTLPHAKPPFHLEEIDKTFANAVVIASNRFKRYLARYHDRFMRHQGGGGRLAWVSRLFGRLRRKATDDQSMTDKDEEQIAE